MNDLKRLKESATNLANFVSENYKKHATDVIKSEFCVLLSAFNNSLEKVYQEGFSGDVVEKILSQTPQLRGKEIEWFLIMSFDPENGKKLEGLSQKVLN